MYDETFTRPLPSENEPPDARGLYGLTKTLGETVVRRFVLCGDLSSALALRLCLPVENAAQVAGHTEAGRDCALSAGDTARAFHAALVANHAGFDALFLVGKAASQRVSIAKAKDLLGWEPEL